MHKNKVVGGKALSFVIGRFCTCYFRLPFEREVLHGSDAFSVIELSNKKDYSSFLKKVSVSSKLLFRETNENVQNTTKIYQSLLPFSRDTYAFSVGFGMNPQRMIFFLC